MPLHFRIFKIAKFISTNGASFSRGSMFEIVWVSVSVVVLVAKYPGPFGIFIYVKWRYRRRSRNAVEWTTLSTGLDRVSINKIVLYDPDSNRQISTWMRRNMLAGWLAMASWAALGRAAPPCHYNKRMPTSFIQIDERQRGTRWKRVGRKRAYLEKDVC